MNEPEATKLIMDVLEDLKLVDAEQRRIFEADGNEDLELAALNIDSMAVIDLCIKLEDGLGRVVQVEELVENPKVRQLARHFSGSGRT